MINKKIISLNILFSLIQIVITGLVYYFLYKYLLQKIGPDLMGVWAIVLSISSTANIANLGIGSGVVRFTALFKTNNEVDKINRLLHTSLISIGGIFIVIIVIIYLVAPMWLHAVIENNYYGDALKIIPFSLLCLLLNALSGIYASCLDGLQKNFLRSIVFIFSFIVLILSTYLLVPLYGLLGVAYAQVLQAIFLLGAMACTLKLVFTQHRIFHFRWDKGIFRSIFSFGAKEQVISICQLCFDPLTKSLLGSFGTLSMVTYYEMANRLVLQLRGLLVSANQVFIPIFTNAQEKSADTVQGLYKRIFSINFLMCVLWFSAIVAFVVPISKIWIGALSVQFVVITIFLAVSYFFNIVISPAYFSNIGSAKLMDNVIGNIIIASLNAGLCFFLGVNFNGYGVVGGWSVALSAGSLFILFAYHRKTGIALKAIFSQQDLYVVLLGLSYSLSCFFFFLHKSELDGWLMFLAALLLFILFCLGIYRIHPVGKQLFNNIRTRNKL